MYERVSQCGFEDITASDSDVLIYVGEAGASASTIARKRRVTKQSVHEQVRSLSARGYIIQTPDPNDGRAVIIKLSSKGRDLVFALSAIKRELQEELVTELGAIETGRLRKLLSIVRQTLSENP